VALAPRIAATIVLVAPGLPTAIMTDPDVLDARPIRPLVKIMKADRTVFKRCLRMQASGPAAPAKR
jgi:hypothetical protein